MTGLTHAGGQEMRVRSHGGSGPRVVVLHGGPAAPGCAAPIARGLADSFRVLEPWQRGSGDEPLTVARHVADLHELVESHCAGARPALVGESWGAMLALAYAARHPGRAGPLVLVGCGTFDPLARDRLRAILEERTSGDLRRRLERLSEEIPDAGQRLEKRYELVKSLYDYDPVGSQEDDPEAEAEPFDVRAHEETWADMVRLQEEGVYPAAFAAIDGPVLMLHGAYDPHPGPLIRASLAPHLPQLEYQELERCGHRPWVERSAREEFFAVLHGWLARQCPATSTPTS
jgi:pimeloyl-ACP methyl ester carboxylesterase